MKNLLCSSFLWEKFSFPWSILSFFQSGLPKPRCAPFWQPFRPQKRKNWSRKRKSFSQKSNCAYELFHFSATLFQLLRRYSFYEFKQSNKQILIEINLENRPLCYAGGGCSAGGWGRRPQFFSKRPQLVVTATIVRLTKRRKTVHSGISFAIMAKKLVLVMKLRLLKFVRYIFSISV